MSRPLAPKGFGLIEIMVGLAIGLIATIIMFQTFAVSERQKRTTTGAADAQTNGALAMFSLERDIKMAGWGFDMAELANCNPFYSWHETETPPGISLFASVLITDGGDGPDSVRIQYFGDPSETNLKFSKTRIARTMPTPSSVYEVDSPYGCTPKVGGPPLFAIVSQAGKGCTLAQITGVNGSDKLMHEKGVSAPYNPAANDTAGWPTYTDDSVQVASVQCFSGLYSRTYAIATNQLELTQPNSTGAMATEAIAPEILDMQARYGVAVAGTQAINQWVTATGDWRPAMLTMPNIRRIKAVQIALLARSAAYEKPEDGSTCTATTEDNAAAWPAWAGFKTSELPDDWQCYRYKVFELTVPLRNIIWAKT